MTMTMKRDQSLMLQCSACVIPALFTFEDLASPCLHYFIVIALATFSQTESSTHVYLRYPANLSARAFCNRATPTLLSFTGAPEQHHTIMVVPNLDVLSWNVRGLNTSARCVTVHELMSATHCHLACFLETKLATVDGLLAAFLSGYKHNCFTHKPVRGTRGGILLLWNNSYIDLRDIVIRRFSITATVSIKDCGTTFSLMVVYGPTRDNRKQAFLQELPNIKPIDDVGWLLLGDFNLIYQARDKNNRN